MIAKAKAIPHGHADLAYIMGESKKKEHARERISFVASHGLDPLCRPREAWEEISLVCRGHRRLTHSVIQIVISPSAEESKGFTDADWARLWQQFAEAFDTLDHRDARGRLISRPTSLRNSLHTVWLHHDSRSGIPHLHAAVCRVDMEGRTNPDSRIDQRAQAAADAINLRRGWRRPEQIRAERIKEIRSQCFAILKAMPRYSLEAFHAELRRLGYEVATQTDSQGRVRGHAISVGSSRYKMSEIDRQLTVDRLPKLWESLRPAETAVKPAAPSKPMQSEAKPIQSDVEIPSYSRPAKGSERYSLGRKAFYIPSAALAIFKEEYNDWQVENSTDMVDLCVAIFVGQAVAPSQSASGGGASDIGRGWGRDPNEDDLAWARRCTRLALQLAKPVPRRRSRGR